MSKSFRNHSLEIHEQRQIDTVMNNYAYQILSLSLYSPTNRLLKSIKPLVSACTAPGYEQLTKTINVETFAA